MVIFFKMNGEIVSTIDNLDTFEGVSPISYLCISGFTENIIKNGRVNINEKVLVVGNKKIKPIEIFITNGNDSALMKQESVMGQKRPIPKEVQENFKRLADDILKGSQSLTAIETDILGIKQNLQNVGIRLTTAETDIKAIKTKAGL